MMRYRDADHEIRTLKVLLRKSLGTIRELNQTAAVEPIAIIGMACELPGGVTTPEQYWSLLQSDRECTRDGPASEWVADVHRRYFHRNPRAARYARANYLDSDVLRFDPRAFAISPKEARDMDPTQRLALKLTAEALERAGHQPRRIDGRVGVYFGVIGGEYGALARQSAEPGSYVATGSLNSVVAGRVSHTFDFDGPAVAVDTACSSSLVALHLACAGIRDGDCDVAVVGGVNLLLDPSIFTVLSGVGALSTDGRCRPFAADGEGYGRGEGGGVVVLKRLRDAVRDRDDVLALVRATAINHDGTCSGLTVPNGRAQQALLEQTLRRSGLRAADVDYLEAHGTGTRLGDPIELSAASAVYCRDRPADRPLVVGSAKAQIGHLEAASGIASLIKLVLVLRNRRVPSQLVAGEPNRTIDFQRLGLRPAAAEEQLPATQPIGAVSSFGFSGTNGHAILSAAPPPEPRRPGERLAAQPILVSARSATALTDQLRRLKDHLAEGDADLEDVGFTLAVGRDHGPFRACLLVQTREQVVRALETRLATPHLVTSSALGRDGAARIGFFLGARGGGRSWYGLFSAFRDGFARVDAAWSELGEPTLTRWLESDAHPSAAAESAALHLALLCGTVRLWQGFGLQPAIWAAEGIGCFAVAIETGARTPRDGLVELSWLVEGAHVLPDGSIDLTGLPAPAIDAPTHGRRLDAAVICPRDNDFVGSRHLADPGYWAAAATMPADLAAAARLCVQHDVRLGLVLGEGGARTRESVLTFVDPGEHDPRQALVRCLLRLYELGVDLDWRPLYENAATRRVAAPTSSLDEAVYAFDAAAAGQAPASSGGLQPVLHLSPGHSPEVEFELDPAELALADTHHVVHIGYFVEMLLRGLALIAPDREFEISDMQFTAALVVRDAPGTVRLVFDGLRGFAFHSLTDAATNRWQQHVHGTLSPKPPEPLDARPPAGQHVQSGAEFYAELATRGMHLGPSVRAIGEVFRHGCGISATIAEEHRTTPVHAAARVAPGLLDACAQLFHAALPLGERSTQAFLVERLQGLTVHTGTPVAAGELRIENVRIAADSAHGRVVIRDMAGQTVLHCATATVRLVERGIDSVVAAADGDALLVTDEDVMAVAAGDRAAVEGVVRRLLARLTGAAEDGIGPRDSTTMLGVDSLQASVLHRALRPIDPDDRIPLADIVSGISVSELTARLLGRRHDVASVAAGYLNGPDETTRVRLLCLPYGGGGTPVFQQWQGLLGDDVDVCPVALPGRGERLGEPLVPDVYDLIDALEPEAVAACDKPVVIYGHSAGALIGYLLALRLRQRGITAVRHLVVGAFSSPGAAENPLYRNCSRALAAAGYPDLPSAEQLRGLDAAALRELAHLMRLPDSDTEFLRLTLPILINDLRLVGSFRARDAQVLDLPITAVHGVGDDRVAEEEMRDWRHRTTAGFHYVPVAGDHFFLHPDQRQKELLDIIREVLK